MLLGFSGAWEEMLLGVELSGQSVTALNVEVDECVRRGQVLQTLDDRTLQSEAKVAQAALTEAAEVSGHPSIRRRGFWTPIDPAEKFRRPIYPATYTH